MEVLPVWKQAGDRSLRHCLHPKQGQRSQLVYPLDDEGLPWLHMGEGEEMKTVIEMAREAGLLYHIPFPSDSHVAVALHRFANLVRADEREACAKLCVSLWDLREDDRARMHANKCAAAIRARSNI